MPNLIDLILTSEKAKGKGGFLGKLGYTAPGHGVRSVKRPGSRGGHTWTDDKGGVHYGPEPKGRGHSGSSAAGAKKPAAKKPAVKKPKLLTNQGKVFKPQTSAGKLATHKRILSEMDKAINLGKDKHGNKLSPKAVEQLRFLATSLRTDLKMSGNAVGKEIQAQIAEKATAHMPFTVFKDAKGQWRWIGVSSSSAEDADRETVSLKALQEDTALKDVTGNYGPLNWWHTPIKLGTCDFNAMDGPLLVESGTFVSEKVAGWVAKAINGGLFKPGMSLEFEHNEPGPQVSPGRVFTKINKVGRALLPAEKASNLLTSFQVYNLNSALAGKEVKEKQMIPEEKLRLLEQFVPKEFLDGLLSGNQTAIKMAEAANFSFKSMTPEPVVVEPPIAEVIPVQVEMVAPEPVAQVEPVVAAAVVETPVPGEVEEVGGENEGFDTEAIFSDLISRIKTEILAALPAQQPVATKEVTDLLAAQTIALKENTNALNTVVAENKSLKERLDALEGNQPAGIRARVTQGQGVPAAELPIAYKELVDPAKKETDPYVTIASQLGLIPAPRG